MALNIKKAAAICEIVQNEINNRFKDLSIHFIVHRTGQRKESMGLAGQEILNHPAAESALHLLTKARRTEDSALLGMAVVKNEFLFGMASRDSLLALASINIDQYDTMDDLKRHAYHMAWHAIDGYFYHGDDKRASTSGNIIVRRRNILEIASANMRADVFSYILTALQGSETDLTNLAHSRGQNVLLARTGHNPEYYPYVIATEATEFAFKRLKAKPVHKKKYIDRSLKIAREVGKAFDDATLKNWLKFAQPAQDMAWRGYSQADILSAAINTSNDTYVRATGYMISEITAIKPSSIIDIAENYSPFADQEFNEKIHEQAIDRIFEDIIAEGLRYSSTDPFTKAANLQNRALLDGSIIGWCASALQAAGRAFDMALQSGKQPELAARKEFQQERSHVEWEPLESLGKKVVLSQRKGQDIVLSDIADMMKDHKMGSSIRRSIDKTLQDPGFQKTLNKSPSPRARTPAPEAQPKMATAPVVGPAVPGLGGSNASRAAAHQAVQKQNAENQAKEKETVE